MRSSSGVVKSSMMLTLFRIVGSLCAFLLFWYISQKSIDQLGAFRTIFVFFLASEFLPLLGMNQYLIREVSTHRGELKKYILHSLNFSLAVSLLLIGVLIGVSFFGRYSPLISKGLLILSAGMPATAAVLCGSSVLVGLGKGTAFALLQGIETIVRTLIGLVVMQAGFGIIGVVIAIVTVRWVIVLFYWLQISPHTSGGEPWGIDLSFLKEFLSHLPMFAGILLFYIVIRYAAQVILPWVSGDTAAGYFAVPYQLLDVAMLVPTAFVINLMPLFARQSQISTAALSLSCRRAIKMIAVVIMPFVIVTCLVAEPLIMIVFGDAYMPSVPVLMLLIWLCLLMSVDQIMSTAFVAGHNQKKDLLTLLIGAAAVVGCLYPGIVMRAQVGAAAALVAGITVLVSVRWVLAMKIIPGLNPVTMLWRAVLASVGLTVTMLMLSGMHWIPRSITGLIVYAVIVVALIYCSRAEKHDIKEMLKADAKSEVSS